MMGNPTQSVEPTSHQSIEFFVFFHGVVQAIAFPYGAPIEN